jgi:hypothetical protein
MLLPASSMIPQFNRYIHKKQHTRLLLPLPPPPPMVTVSLEQYLQSQSYEVFIPTWEPDALYSWATDDSTIKALLEAHSREANSAKALLVAVETPACDIFKDIRALWASLALKKRTVDSVILLVQLKELEDPPFTPALSAERREEDLLYGMRGLSRAWVEDGNTAEHREKGYIGFEYGDPGIETVDHEGDKYLVITIPVAATGAASLKRKISDGDGDGDLPPARKVKLDGDGGAGGSQGGEDGGGGGGGSDEVTGAVTGAVPSSKAVGKARVPPAGDQPPAKKAKSKRIVVDDEDSEDNDLFD